METAEALSGADPGVRDQLVETVLLDLQVECTFGDPEFFGRQGQIALTRNDGGADRGAFRRFQIHDRWGRWWSARLGSCFLKRSSDIRGKVRDRHRFSGRHENRSLDNVAQFPDVPRPR